MSDTTADPQWEQVAEFQAALGRWAGNNRDKALEITLSVAAEHKYEAMPVTDTDGRMLRVIVERQVFPGFDEAQ